MVCALPREAYTSRYLGLCVLLSGSYVASPLTVAWITGNIEGMSFSLGVILFFHFRFSGPLSFAVSRLFF